MADQDIDIANSSISEVKPGGFLLHYSHEDPSGANNRGTIRVRFTPASTVHTEIFLAIVNQGITVGYDLAGGDAAEVANSQDDLPTT